MHPLKKNRHKRNIAVLISLIALSACATTSQAPNQPKVATHGSPSGANPGRGCTVIPNAAQNPNYKFPIL